MGLNVRVLFVLVDAALKVEVIPAGSPDTAKLTLLLKLFWLSTVMVELTFAPPTSAVRLAAEEERLK